MGGVHAKRNSRPFPLGFPAVILLQIFRSKGIARYLLRPLNGRWVSLAPPVFAPDPIFPGSGEGERRKGWQKSAKSFLTKSAGWGNDSDWHAKGMAHRMQFHSSFLKMKRSIFGSVVKSRSKIFKTKKEVRT
jgi:hypothetical protein